MPAAGAAPGAADGGRVASPPLLAPGEDRAGHVAEEEVQAWLPLCRTLPKAELHAHINGCVRDATIRCARVHQHGTRRRSASRQRSAHERTQRAQRVAC